MHIKYLQWSNLIISYKSVKTGVFHVHWQTFPSTTVNPHRSATLIWLQRDQVKKHAFYFTSTHTDTYHSSKTRVYRTSKSSLGWQIQGRLLLLKKPTGENKSQSVTIPRYMRQQFLFSRRSLLKNWPPGWGDRLRFVRVEDLMTTEGSEESQSVTNEPVSLRFPLTEPF